MPLSSVNRIRFSAVTTFMSTGSLAPESSRLSGRLSGRTIAIIVKSALVMRETAATRQALPVHKVTHGLLRTFLRLVPVLIAAFGAGAAQASSGSVLACSLFDSSQSLWAAADFDGDKSVDLARVRVKHAGDSVLASGVDLFAFCKNSVPPIFGSFPQVGLVLSARDIDADHDQDLVLRDVFAGEALGVWLNDGTGRFSETEPADYPGAGDDPPGVRNRATPLHRPDVSSPSSKTYASLTPTVGPARFAPSSRRRAVEIRAHVTRGWQDVRQSRGPPLLSC